jgi:hypothetical protein
MCGWILEYTYHARNHNQPNNIGGTVRGRKCGLRLLKVFVTALEFIISLVCLDLLCPIALMNLMHNRNSAAASWCGLDFAYDAAKHLKLGFGQEGRTLLLLVRLNDI